MTALPRVGLPLRSLSSCSTRPSTTVLGRVLQRHSAQADASAGKQQAHAGREVARVGMLAIMRALAATKLYQASALRAVATTVQAIAPAVADVARASSKSRSPTATSSLDDEADRSSASPAPPPTLDASQQLPAEAAEATHLQLGELTHTHAPADMPAAQAPQPPLNHALPTPHMHHALTQTDPLPPQPAPATPSFPPHPLATTTPPQPAAPPAFAHTAIPPSHAPPQISLLHHAPALQQQHLHLHQQQQQPAQLTVLTAPRMVVVADAQQAAALWAEELRHMQLRRQHLSDEVDELLARHQQHRHSHRGSPGAEGGYAAADAGAGLHAYTSLGSMPAMGTLPEGAGDAGGEGLFVDAGGPEFCPLTCQVETAVEVRAAREAIRQQVAAMTERCVWTVDAAAAAEAAAGATPAEASHVRELQMAWEAAASDVTYLMVRLSVLQQLPAQPKQRPTVRHVKHEVLQHLHDRLVKLAASHLATTGGGAGVSGSGAGLVGQPVQGVAVGGAASFLPQAPLPWQVDVPVL